jgi:hypothetical protein
VDLLRALLLEAESFRCINVEVLEVLDKRIPLLYKLFPELVERVHVLKLGELVLLCDLTLNGLSVVMYDLLPLHIPDQLLKVKVFISEIIQLLLLLVHSVSVLP